MAQTAPTAITPLPAAPNTNNTATFSALMDALLAALIVMVPQQNTQNGIVYSNAQDAYNNAVAAAGSAVTASGAQAAAVAAANFKGNWASLTGALAMPASVAYGSRVWMLTANTADVTTITPGVSASWLAINDVLGLGAPIASAATVNLDTSGGKYVHITGTATITAFTLASGSDRVVVFDGVLTLTHNATTLILPGLANIITAAGDRATVVGDGTGNVRVIHYTRATGLPLVAPPSGWTLLPASTVIASGAAYIDVEWSATAYDQIVVVFSGVTMSADSQNLSLRMKVGGAYDTGSNYLYHTSIVDTANAGYGSLNTSAGAQSSITIGSGVGNSAGKAIDLFVYAHNPASTNLMKKLQMAGNMQKPSGALQTASGIAQNSSTSALTGIRLFASSANLTGTGRAYGVQNS